MPIVSAMSRPPSAPAAAIFAVRLMSVLAPEAAEPFACLGLDRSVARGFERLSAALRGDRGGEVGELLRLEREKLVAGLRRLQSTARRLAGADERVDRRAGAVDIADNASLQRSEEHTSELQSLMR